MAAVDQQRIRRSRTGLIAHAPGRAFQGYTLFTPIFGGGTVYLLDMHGEVVHTWRLPYRPGLYGYLLDDGHLFYSGKVMEDLERFEAWPRFKAGAALEVDWSGRVLWEVRHPDHHDDARRLRNGNVLLLCLRPVPDALRARIRGGLPGTEAPAGIYGDYLVEMTTRGQVVWEWRSWEHLDPETEVITPQDHRHEWTHGNTVAELPDGNLVLSFRNVSTAPRSAARPAPPRERPPPDLRQWSAPPRSPGALLARHRGRPAHELPSCGSTATSRSSTSSARTSRARSACPTAIR